MDKVRLATSDEVEQIIQGSDITPATTVVAFDNAKTGKPDLAVLRLAFEMDPVLYAEETSNRRKVLFAWAIENSLRIQGNVPGYYFNLSASEEAAEWRGVVEGYGAIKVSPGPEYRYYKALGA